ncbi:MAG: hypothetical protein U1F51_04630 [Burkholderiales bacterium]
MTPPRAQGAAARRADAAITADEVRARRAALTRFGPGSADSRTLALADVDDRGFADVAALVEWHDLMLFVVAHPAAPAEVVAAERGLDAAARAARDIAQGGRTRDRRALEETGLSWSTVRANFGLAIARWLSLRHPGCARVDEVDESSITLAESLAPGLPALQAEIAAGGTPEAAGLPAAFGGSGADLGWLVRAFDRLPVTEAVREQIWDRVQPSLIVSPRDGTLARTRLRGLASDPAYVDRLVREVDVRATIGAPLQHAPRRSLAERQRLVDAGRGTLAVLGRETDALSCTSARDTRWLPLGRGLAIALHAPAADRRGPLDTHVGFVLYRNSVPVAYGGGWPFAGGCRIGVNVFPAFRGGESAVLFAQVLRAYRSSFGVERFLVEPYQYGLGNREGLESGAFWFYWRLGFRPVDHRVHELALSEATKVEADRAYRAPITVLRRFTTSDIALDLVPGAAPPEPSALAERGSAWLARHARGDPSRAERVALGAAQRALGRRAPATGPRRAAWVAWAPLVAQLAGIDGWSQRDRTALAAIIEAKAADEFDFQRRVVGHRRLREELRRLAQTPEDRAR